jgi:uncharacterized protein
VAAEANAFSEVEMETRKTNPKLLELLVCPITKTRLEFDADKSELISRAAGLAYPIRDGIPIMIAGEARELHRE